MAKLVFSVALLLLGTVLASPPSFLNKPEANSFIHSRAKRYNSGNFEEASTRANYERECIEEICSMEEYLEVAENLVKNHVRPRARSDDFKIIYQDCWRAMDGSEYAKRSASVNFKKACFLAYHQMGNSGVKLEQKYYDLFV